MFGLSLGHWLVVLVVMVLLFGTNRLRNIGGDLGAAIKSFKSGLKDDPKDPKNVEDKVRADS